MEDLWLATFEGQHVTVVTGAENERSDTGTLVRIGSSWLQLVKDNGEMLLVPASAVRAVKLLDMHVTTPATPRDVLGSPVVQPTYETHVETRT